MYWKLFFQNKLRYTSSHSHLIYYYGMHIGHNQDIHTPKNIQVLHNVVILTISAKFRLYIFTINVIILFKYLKGMMFILNLFTYS
jgi:hypothetical protein